MKRFGFGLLSLLIIPLFVTQHSFADSSVTIINNSVNSSSSTTASSNCHTTVHMETNGQEQNYDSGDCNNVTMESDNGSNSVHITNNSPEDTKSTVSPTDSPMPTQRMGLPTIATMSLSPKPIHDTEANTQKEASKAAIQVKKMKQYQQDFFRRLQDFFKKFFLFL